MSKKLDKENWEKRDSSFAFRVKIGDYEVEIRGTHEEVTKTIENLPALVMNVHKAMENVKPKTVATLTVKTEPATKEEPDAPSKSYPKITAPASCAVAVMRILETDWGKWRPRTVDELKDAVKANDLKYGSRELADTLNKLSEKGAVRRWNTNTGFVYILAERKSSRSGDE